MGYIGLMNETMTYSVPAIHCNHCAMSIREEVSEVQGVESVDVDLDEKIVTITGRELEDAQLRAAVEAAGYHARPVHETDGHHHHDEPLALLGRRLAAAVALTVPIALLAMVPPLQFAGWEWFALALATPVVLGSGSEFHRAALQSARHLAATMDTLISMGTLAAWLWSTVVLLGGLDADTYFEVAAVITTLILLGRFLEARAKSRSGEAIRRLLELGAREARVLRDGQEVLVPIDALQVGDRFVVRPGERIATDGVVEEGASAIDQSL